MKKLIASVMVSLFATGAFATSIDRTQVIAKAEGYYKGLEMVALLADGRLQMKNYKGAVTQVRLSKPAFDKLSSELTRIADAEVKTVEKQFICLTIAAIMPTTLSRLSV